MKNNGFILLRTLLLSSSSRNVLKTTHDKKKKNKIIGSCIGMGILYLMIVVYGVISSIGYAYYGMGDQLPDMAAVCICAISFVLTVLKAGSYLFGFREYEMLMALPFSEKSIVGSKFLYMYIKTLPWILSISISMLIGYGIILSPAWYVYPLWIVLSAILPIIPMLAASFIGFLIARIGTAFKFWKAVQTALTFVFVALCFSLRFILEKLFRNGEVGQTFANAAQEIEKIGNIYLPVSWFSDAITKGNIAGIILLPIVSALLFELVFFILSKSYKKINSKMKTVTVTHKFKFEKMGQRSVVQAIADKEIRRLFGSTAYLTNVGIGYIFAIALGVISLFVGLDKIIATLVQGAPVTTDMVLPALPFIIYFMAGMMPTTTCSPSLEGNNYWILKSSPIRNKDIYLGKILANLYLAVPAQLLGTLFLCISAKVPLFTTIIFMLLGIVLCVFSSVFGCACGVHFMKLDWENEIEAIKQGTAVVIYIFPNMILTCILLVGSIFLANAVGMITGTVIIMAAYAVLSVIFYFRTMKLAKDR